MSNTASANAAVRCQHIFADNVRCKAPSLRDQNFCHWHQTSRDALANRKNYFPLLEDANSVQLSLSHVFRELMSSEITPYHASVAFSGLQVAFQVQQKISIDCRADHAVTELTPAVEAERKVLDNPLHPTWKANGNGGRSPSDDGTAGYSRDVSTDPEFAAPTAYATKYPPAPAISLDEPVFLTPDETAFAMDLFQIKEHEVAKCIEECRHNNPEYYPVLIDRLRKGGLARRAS